MHHNEANNMIPSPTPYYMRHFQIFDEVHCFLKNLLNVPDSKERYIASLKNRLI